MFWVSIGRSILDPGSGVNGSILGVQQSIFYFGHQWRGYLIRTLRRKYVYSATPLSRNTKKHFFCLALQCNCSDFGAFLQVENRTFPSSRLSTPPQLSSFRFPWPLKFDLFCDTKEPCEKETTKGKELTFTTVP